MLGWLINNFIVSKSAFFDAIVSEELLHSLSSPLLYCVSIKNPCILKKTHIAVFGPVQNSDNIENITIPKFLQQDLCVPSIFIKIIGYSLNIFTKNNNILKDITINKIYNIGVVTKSLQYIKDNKQDYRKFLCNDKIFVVLSKCDKLVGYDDKIITNNFINKFILENEDHCEILNDKKIIKKFKLFIRK